MYVGKKRTAPPVKGNAAVIGSALAQLWISDLQELQARKQSIGKRSLEYVPGDDWGDQQKPKRPATPAAGGASKPRDPIPWHFD